MEVCSKLYNVMLENVTSHACTDDEGSEFVGETLLEKKITRQQTYYKVRYSSTFSSLIDVDY